MPKIKIDHTKCTGCRHCEIACSLNHVAGESNPRRARIRVFHEGRVFFPVIAGPFVDAACTSKTKVQIDNHLYDMCVLCRASCPEKPFFIEAQTGIALKCDFCGIPPDPSCVRICNTGALELVEDR
jgi:Fe-S-cluster-containing hydrogenase component 2